MFLSTITIDDLIAATCHFCTGEAYVNDAGACEGGCDPLDFRAAGVHCSPED